MGRRVTEIALVFKRAPHLPFDATMTEELGTNALVIRVQPDEGITLRFGSKVPGSAMEVRDVNMDFSYGSAFAEDSPEAYERLILDVLLGEPSLFPGNAGGRIVLGDTRSRAGLLGRARKARSVRVGHLGPGVGVRDAAAFRPGMETPMIRAGESRARRAMRRSGAMIVDLPNTTTNELNKKITALREEGGAITLGRVLTLVIAPDSLDLVEDAIDAAVSASREHPCRIIVVVPDDRLATDPRLDGQLRVGGDAGAGEVVVLKISGPLSAHASSVVLPFLLPDTPVVAWWPGVPPAVPAQDPLGRLALRRITDATGAADPLASIKGRLEGYTNGDTDLAWSRITYWRALLASALDQPPYEEVTSALVSGLKTEPALDILAGWLASRIDGTVQRAVGELKVELVRPVRDGDAEPAAGRGHRHADPHRPAGCPAAAAAPRDPRVPGRGSAPARRRRDLPRGAGGYRQGAIRLKRSEGLDVSVVVETYPDTSALVAAAGDRLVEAITSAIAARGQGTDRADRRRHRDRTARARPRPRRRGGLVEGAPVLG